MLPDSDLSKFSFSIIITSRSDLSLGSESVVCIASAKSAKNSVSPADRSVALRLKSNYITNYSQLLLICITFYIL